MLCTDVILGLLLSEKGNFPKCWTVTLKNCSFYLSVMFPCSFYCLASVSLQNSTCELNSSCGGKDPLWSPSSLCGMATPPSSRGMSPNLELSHSASHLPSRFHCTSGRHLYDYNRFPLGWQFIEVFIMFLTERRSGIFLFFSPRGCFDLSRRERNACLQHSSHLFPASHPIRWLPHNLLTSQHSPVQSTEKGMLFPLHVSMLLEKCLFLPIISSSSTKSLRVNQISLNMWRGEGDKLYAFCKGFLNVMGA